MNPFFSVSGPGPTTSSPCTITMDLDEIVCSMIDRQARSRSRCSVPKWAAKEVPFSLCRSHINLLVFETLIPMFSRGAIGSKLVTFFACRISTQGSLWDQSWGQVVPRPHAHVLGALRRRARIENLGILCAQVADLLAREDRACGVRALDPRRRGRANLARVYARRIVNIAN